MAPDTNRIAFTEGENVSTFNLDRGQYMTLEPGNEFSMGWGGILALKKYVDGQYIGILIDTNNGS